MQKVSQKVQDILSSGHSSMFIAMSIYTDVRGYNYTSLPYEIMIDGEVYQPDRNVISFSPPKVGSSLDREAFGIKLGMIDPELWEILETGYHVIRTRVYLGFMDPVTNQPLTSMDDLLMLHDGVIDSIEKVMDSGDMYITISSASPMADFDTVKSYVTEPRYQKDILPGDICYDFVSGRDREITLKWGK